MWPCLASRGHQVSPGQRPAETGRKRADGPPEAEMTGTAILFG